MSPLLYRAHLADGSVKRVKVVTLDHARYVEGDRYPLSAPVAEAVAAHGRTRGWTVVGVSAPPGVVQSDEDARAETLWWSMTAAERAAL